MSNGNVLALREDPIPEDLRKRLNEVFPIEEQNSTFHRMILDQWEENRASNKDHLARFEREMRLCERVYYCNEHAKGRMKEFLKALGVFLSVSETTARRMARLGHPELAPHGREWGRKQIASAGESQLPKNTTWRGALTFVLKEFGEKRPKTEEDDDTGADDDGEPSETEPEPDDESEREKARLIARIKELEDAREIAKSQFREERKQRETERKSLQSRLETLRAENARLKAEIEALRQGSPTEREAESQPDYSALLTVGEWRALATLERDPVSWSDIHRKHEDGCKTSNSQPPMASSRHTDEIGSRETVKRTAVAATTSNQSATGQNTGSVLER